MKRSVKFIIWLLFLMPKMSFSSSGITYHGRLLDPNGVPVTSSNVQFRMQIRTPGIEDCLLYEEIQTLDLSATSGMFALSLADGSGVRQDSNSWTLFEALSNRKPFSFSAGDCIGVNSYTPVATDNRNFRVFFNDGTFPAGTWEALPIQTINFIPMSIESYAVGGFPATSLLRVETAGTLGTTTPLTSTQYAEILNLVNGNSSQYEKDGELNGSAIPSLGAGQTVTSDGSGGWVATTPITSESDPTVEAFAKASLPTCAAGEVLKSDGTSLSCVTDSAGTLPDMVTAGTYSKVTVDAKGRVTAGASITGDDITSGEIDGTASINTSGNITTSGSVTSGSVSTKQLDLYDSDNTNFIRFLTPATGTLTTDYTVRFPADDGSSGQVLSTDGNGTLSWISLGIPKTCTSAQTMTWSAVTDVFSCTNISITASQVSDLSTELADYVEIAGDTMSGALTVNNTVTVNGAIVSDHTSASYDVWIQGGQSGASGGARNLAFLGTVEGGGDTLYVNYNGEYSGGTRIGGVIYGDGSGLSAVNADTTDGFHLNQDVTTSGSPTFSTTYSGWFRSLGNTGWYSQTYGGGWYMTDATYIRNYGDKSVQVSKNSGTPALYGVNTGAHYGLQGHSAGSYGIVGSSDATYAIMGRSNSAAHGGVLGYSQNSAVYGILGHSNTYAFYGAGHVYGSGNFTSGGSMNATAFYYTSDRRYKNSIRVIENPLDIIVRLNGVRFKWNKDNSDDIGFIAQEVEDVVPELVTSQRDPQSKEEFKAVKYGNIVAIAVEAIKELKQFVDQIWDRQDKMEERLLRMEERIRQLEEENEQLRGRRGK